MVDPGENLYEGAVREVLEETGLSVEQSMLVPAYADSYIYDDTTSVLRVFFLVELGTDDGEITISWEHEAYEWLTVDELRSLDIRESHKRAIEFVDTAGFLN